MIERVMIALGLVLAAATSGLADDRPQVLVVVGAGGEAEYGQQFRVWAARWQAAAQRAGADFSAIGLEEAEHANDSPGDRDLLAERLKGMAGSASEPLWLVLIGHGTFDSKVAKFNLRGPDITPAELAAWLRPIERPLAIAVCASSSGPFINELSGPRRVVLTATRSGFEINFSRFGDYLSAAIADPAADLDKDEQTSLLEAFLKAAAATGEFYRSEGRLATEHALVDDNGDRLGTPADWFQGLRAVKAAKDGASLDGLAAGQMVLVRSAREEQLSAEARALRDRLESDLAALRARKSQLSEDEYLTLLEPVLVSLARLYQQAEESQRPAP